MPVRGPATPEDSPASWDPSPRQALDAEQFEEEEAITEDDGFAAPDDLRATLPRLHRAAYEGDLGGVLECIIDPLAVHDTVRVRNQAGKVVCGITPLFLAAQRGHTKVVKLLISTGANPAQPAYIEDTDDLCTPAQVARLNFHFWTARYLNQAVASRKQGDKIIKKEEKFLKAADATNSQQAIVNLGDLTNWDPAKDDAPTAQSKGFVSSIFSKKKPANTVTKWKLDSDVDGGNAKDMATSHSRVPDARELMELETGDHNDTLNAYLGQAPPTIWEHPDRMDSLRGASSMAAASRLSQDGVDGYSRSGSPGHTRGPAAAPATLMQRAMAGAAQGKGKAAAAPRWYSHGDSESEDEEEQLEASSSHVAPPGTRF